MMAEQEYKSKTPVEVAMFMKDNGVSGDICDVFEGKFCEAHAFISC